MKKKIDDIYRERFRDVETTPPPEAWQNISAALPQKKKRRMLPLWYEVAGTAAALALLFTIYQAFTSTSGSTDVRLVGFDYEKNPLELSTVSQNFRESMIRSSIILEALKMNTGQELQNTATPSGEAIRDLGSYFADISEESTGPVQTELTYTFSNYLMVNPLIIASEQNPEGNNATEKTAATKASGLNDILAATDPTNPTTPEKEKTPEDIAEATAQSKRFSVTTTAAAVYFDNLGGGNALDRQFAANSSSGELSMAYGINVAYKLTSRVKVRTGVSKVNLSHNTNNVDFVAAAQSEVLNSPELNSSTAFATLASSEASSGHLNQNLGFIEVPLEMEFALVDKKIGINIIGGASTFFLDENMISHNSPLARTELGEANNLNNISFSTNIGLGINYNISQQFQLNLEPIFKYQLNTYNNSAGLSPYIFGVYSGLSFKF